MRRLKHKHTRRAIQFYEINYGFRKPYKVLISCSPSLQLAHRQKQALQ